MDDNLTPLAKVLWGMSVILWTPPAIHSHFFPFLYFFNTQALSSSFDIRAVGPSPTSRFRRPPPPPQASLLVPTAACRPNSLRQSPACACPSTSPASGTPWSPPPNNARPRSQGRGPHITGEGCSISSPPMVGRARLLSASTMRSDPGTFASTAHGCRRSPPVCLHRELARDVLVRGSAHRFSARTPTPLVCARIVTEVNGTEVGRARSLDLDGRARPGHLRNIPVGG